MKQGHLFIISGPAGTGKTTIVRKLLKKHPEYAVIPTYTTRPRREEDKQRFSLRNNITEAEFQDLIQNNELIEWSKVHNWYYGKKKTDIENALAQNKIIVFDIDVQGTSKYKKIFPQAHLIFLRYSDLSRLRERILRTRPDCSEEELNLRYSTAINEMTQIGHYDYVIESLDDDIEGILPALKVEDIVKNTLANQPDDQV